MSHSKRNTSLAFFTSHERAELKSTWGRQRTRLTRESFLPIASCALCLQPAREPVACASGGHVFCRECAVANLLAQLKEIKRVEKELKRKRREEEERQKEKGNEERERVVNDFERVVMGRGSSRAGEGDQKGGDLKVRGLKRKFEIDEEEMLRNAKEERARARRELDEEKASRPTLPSFWVPSLTPNSEASVVKPQKPSPVCPASDVKRTHPLSLKTLVTISFSTPQSVASSLKDKPPSAPSTSSSFSFICPSCKKGLSAATKAVLTVPCGHVICKPCVDQFIRPSGLPPDPHAPSADQEEVKPEALLCLVCETNLSARQSAKDTGEGDTKAREEKEKLKPGLVQLSTEGTGFAGGGKNTVERAGTAFQC